MKKIVLFALLALSAQAQADTLAQDRLAVISAYINDLQNADNKHIIGLFQKGAIVISTSRGSIDAKEFFDSFLPQLASAYTLTKQTFVTTISGDEYAARFYFSYQMKDGSSGKGEYIDEFNFTPGSSKLESVYMFENTKFN